MILAIVGPTGSGKTELAIELAEHCGAEIINADSRQVYRRLEIGSAKPTRQQRARVPHHLVDVADPRERFDAARFRELAVAAIEDIHARGKRAMVVGGTGLYVKILRGGIFAGPPRDDALRARLEAEEAAQPGVLYERVCRIDAEAETRLHPNDRMRLVRALEVYELTGRPIGAWQREHAFAERPYAWRTLGLDWPRAALYARIDDRCRAMVTAGLVEEVRGLLDDGIDLASTAMNSPGYRQIIEHLRGDYDLDEAIERMAQATRRLAKRQLTWFRGDPELTWVRPELDALIGQTTDLW